MLPVISLMNHSAPFLCAIQRRLKTEPVDLYLYHQTETSVTQIMEHRPKVIVLARRYGFPANDWQFIQALQHDAMLNNVPIVLSLLDGMQPPAGIGSEVRIIVSKPDLSDLEDIVTTLHQILHIEG